MTEIKIDIEQSKLIKEKIAIIGTGNFGISIGKRFLHYGFQVIYGSRNPNLEYLKECFDGQNNSYEVMSITEAWNQVDLIILAISPNVYESFVHQIITNHSISSKSKTIVEISNLKNSKNLKISNAQKLESMIKDKLYQHKIDFKINIIKGFNLTSAHSLSSFLNKSSLIETDITVPIAGNNIDSKNKVIDLCSKIGIKAYDFGGLDSSLRLELANNLTFNEWKYPTLISLIYFFLIFLWFFIHIFVFNKKQESFEDYIKKFSVMTYIIKASGFASLHLLAFVYLGSVVASIYQLKNGTKYKLFPKWLNFWLKTRKQFGLWAFMFGTLHAILSIMIVNPQYAASWFKKTDDGKFGKMTLNGEMNTITGVFTYILLVLVALASINSIANSLNWSEWNFVQTKIGLASLFMGVLHCFVMYFRQFAQSKEIDVYLFTKTKFLAIIFPGIVLVLRFVFGYFWPLSKKIEKIRNGKILKNYKA